MGWKKVELNARHLKAVLNVKEKRKISNKGYQRN